MAESHVLATPIVASVPETITEYRVTRFILQREPFPQVVITVMANDGSRKNVVYEENAALVIMSALNKTNLSAKSLHARILERIAADGYLPSGTVTGIPD
jgi:hypothetical protein